MRINTNINSMRTQEYMRQNQAKMSTAMDRLSSGKRINNASDDAAGLAIATRMRARESGLGVAANNTQDGISLIRTADSAMNSVSNILLRMRDLANQSANGTNTDKNQGALDKEFAALKEQIDYISKNTEFNDKKLLDGSNKAIAIQTLDSDDKGKQIDIKLSDSSTAALKINNLSIAANGLGIGSGKELVGVADATVADATADALVKLNATTGAADTARTTAVNSFKDQYKDVKDGMNAAEVEKIDAAIKKFEASGGNTLENANEIGKLFQGSAKAITKTQINDVKTAATALTNLTTTSDPASRTTAMNTFVNAFNAVKGSMNKADVTKIEDAIDRFNKTDNSGNTLEAARTIGDAFTAATTDGPTSTANDANAAIKAIDAALETIASNRATLGATLNRLDFNVNNLKNQASSMASAASQVEDADMAKEMSEMTKFKILNEAGISMLSQANQTPQMVSKLLQ
ncbi:flagellin N-terminal helical domain-containing protein [Bacillus tropicus]|uniref:flagellin N-terminal helical domain-containing protein n=1 Tax=Bacillus tropicus TaxID=2026188 RepID=UPI0021D24C9A|nr:flagellin [Bacillus tropicus]MCU5221274.1 flagellin [Bacillus tropicus]